MAVTPFAAIHVGSNEVSMKIFEVSKKYGIKEITHIRHMIELGSETYTDGSINHSSVEELCRVLNGFCNIMKEYNVTAYSAYATSAVRESSNNIIILDQIKLQCNLKVKILSNSEQRFLFYKAIALKESAFDRLIKTGTIIVDAGAGSVQFSLFDKGVLAFTQNIKLGSLRMKELLGSLAKQTDNYNNVISEYIRQDLMSLHDIYLKNIVIKNIIATGDQIYDLKKYAAKHDFSSIETMKSDDFNKFFKLLSEDSTQNISSMLNIQPERASLLLPTAMIYQKICSKTKADQLWLCGITLTDGIVAEYAERKEKIIPSHDFNQDIISCSNNIAKKYLADQSHTKNVEFLGLKIFDSLKKLHGLGKRERLLLQISILLHTCGSFINIDDVAENTYKIIMSTEIIGLSHLERVTIANIVRYNTESFPDYKQLCDVFDKETYIIMIKLTAILRIANAMDKSHMQKITNLRLNLSDHSLTFHVSTMKDITLEQELFKMKAVFFEKVYGIRPILKQKRSDADAK